MSLKRFEHVILTRFNTKEITDENVPGRTETGLLYDKPYADEWMKNRMPLWRECKRSILSQRDDFRWIVSVDERTPEKYMKEIRDDRIEITHGPIQRVKIETDAPWVITTRIDNDDQLLPGAIRTIQRHFEPKIKVIDIGVMRLDWETGDLYVGDVGGGRSMFVSLVESSERVLTVFCRPHSSLGHGYPTRGDWDSGFKDFNKVKIDVVHKPLALMVCHGNNIANAIHRKLRTGHIKDYR